MTPAPIIDSKTALQDYLQATKAITGVVQAPLQHYVSVAHMQAQLNYEWPLFFTPVQQEAIVIEYTVRRLER